MPGRFVFEGRYRVQSASTSFPSRIEGEWIEPAEGAAACGLVNRRLRSHPFWRGRELVRLKAATVLDRQGAFADNPDILYKLSHFTPAPGTSAMDTNIVDVDKAARNWRIRRPYLHALLGREAAEQVQARIGSIRSVAAAEYMMHEAGHCLGIPTEEKYRAGYFRLGGKTIWPLVHLEELRADLLSFGFAAEALKPDAAAGLFLYNVFLRLGVDLEGRATRCIPPYGPIPGLLFVLLHDAGALAPGDDDIPLRLIASEPADIVAVMQHCARRALAELVEHETHDISLLDSALAAAGYYHRQAERVEVSSYDAVRARALARHSTDKANRSRTGSLLPSCELG